MQTIGAIYAADHPHNSLADVAIEEIYHELKAVGGTITLALLCHPYGADDDDQETRFIDPDGNEWVHTSDDKRTGLVARPLIFRNRSMRTATCARAARGRASSAFFKH
jgi:hypothetical protein